MLQVLQFQIITGMKDTDLLKASLIFQVHQAVTQFEYLELSKQGSANSNTR